MERFLINGGRSLHGETRVNGAKNAVLPILAACLLSNEETVLHRVPRLADVSAMCQVLEACGGSVCWQGDSLLIKPAIVAEPQIPEDLIKKMRASNLILGPLLCRLGSISLPFPGGCCIGPRPMNYHISAFKQLGATISDEGSYIRAHSKNMKGKEVCLDFPSVGATENIMMAAAGIPGRTQIRNAAREPEIVDLAIFLQKMGAEISGAGSDMIFVEGREDLHGAEHEIMADRIEAGTLLIAAAITCGDVLLQKYDGCYLTALIAKMKEAGVEVSQEIGGLRARGLGRPRRVHIRTMPYPGFPTDMQPQFMALTTLGEGASIVVENIFENRFRHVDEMRRLGAEIQVLGSEAAVVTGRPCLSGAPVEVSDLRAGAALVLMGLAAQGQTTVEKICYIDRGYERMEDTLSALGADIKRVKS